MVAIRQGWGKREAFRVAKFEVEITARLGELLNGTTHLKHGPGRGKKKSSPAEPFLCDLGVTKKLSHVAQRVASVKPKARERYFAECADKGSALCRVRRYTSRNRVESALMGKDAPRLRPRRRRRVQRHIDAEVMEFIRAVDAYRLEHGLRFLKWSEILEVVKALGYRKVKASTETT